MENTTLKTFFSRLRPRQWAVGGLICAGVFLLGAFLGQYYHARPFLQAEYGLPLPPASAFAGVEEACYAPEERLKEKGLHLLLVEAGRRRLPCLLLVKDTVAPAARGVELTFPVGRTPGPEAFVAEVKDADRVAVAFEGAYDFTLPGDCSVQVRLTDESGNTTLVTATATVTATVEELALEAGSPLPTAADFSTEGFHARLTEPIAEQVMQEPGVYEVTLRCEETGQHFPSRLRVVDTVPPVVTGQLTVMAPEAEPQPEDYIAEARDETALSFAFVVAPDPDNYQLQDVVVAVTDKGGNQTEVAAQALFSHVGRVIVERREGLLRDEDLSLPGWSVVAASAEGEGEMLVEVTHEDGRQELALVYLTDTTPPALSLSDKTFYLGHPQTAEELVAAEDMSETSLSFLTEPDWNEPGEQTFSVSAVDSWGNEASGAFAFTLLPDETPPTLYGVVNRTCYVNEPITYFQEAYAQDEVDGRVEMAVDSSVILGQAGRYSVTFSATDESGNTAQKTVTYTLVNPAATEEQVQAMAREVIEKIITEDMVTAQKLKAVFDYVRGRVRYVGTSDKTDWRKEALRGANEGRGDCFTVYSLTRALLDELEIPYMSVTRKSTATRHYWVIVNIGTGWYHFDPLVTAVHKHYCFMWTNRQCKVKPYFWRFNEENFPPIAEEPFMYEQVVLEEQAGRLP